MKLTFRSHNRKRWEISIHAEQLAASQGLCSIKLVKKEVKYAMNAYRRSRGTEVVKTHTLAMSPLPSMEGKHLGTP
jgi:hypothetical protein